MQQSQGKSHAQFLDLVRQAQCPAVPVGSHTMGNASGSQSKVPRVEVQAGAGRQQSG